MKKRKINTTELVLYIIFGVVAVGGLVLVTLGMIGEYINVHHNVLRDADKAFAEAMKMSFVVFGSLLVFVGALAAAITLATFGHRAELESDRRARRLQRLALEDAQEPVEESKID